MSILDLILANRMVAAAYTIAILLLAGYALSIVFRRRATDRQLAAWTEVGVDETAAQERDT